MTNAPHHEEGRPPAPQALKAAIDTGRFPEHPTWEDVIGWNNLIAFTQRVGEALRLLQGDQQ
ncbi:MAG: hypothetical protein H5U04_04330 [Firmicutes bacterium]|nr:hypothetical protein [Bacillota bacterium]